MDLTTPALLFPAISLLFLAYTNRFLVLAQLIRQLHAQHRNEARKPVLQQIANLKRRILLIKLMQIFGVTSFIICSLSMMALFLEMVFPAEVLFGFSIFFLVLSLLVSLYEIIISTNAIQYELNDMEVYRNTSE